MGQFDETTDTFGPDRSRRLHGGFGWRPAAVAAPDTADEHLCTIKYPTPEGDFSTYAASEAFASSHNDGTFDLTLHTDANSDTGYDQQFRVVWANLDTGRSGGGDTSARVQGPDNVLSIPAVNTKPGRIALTLSVFNHGEAQNYTNGDCTLEYVAH